MGEFSNLGKYGALAVFFFVAAFNYEKAPYLFGMLLLLNFLFLIIVSSIDLYHFHEILRIEKYR